MNFLSKVVSDETGLEHALYGKLGPDITVTSISSKAREVKPGAMTYFIDETRPVDRRRDGSYIDRKTKEVFRET